MTIQPHTLRATIELTLGCRPDIALIEHLARTLEDPDEILPWLVLRQNLFANDPAAMAQLHALAATANRPTPTRPYSAPILPATQVRDRRLEEYLKNLITTEVAHTDLINEIDAQLHRVSAVQPDERTGNFLPHISRKM